MVDSCGCIMGAQFLAGALVACTLWYLWHWNALRLAAWRAGMHVMLWSVFAAGTGKAVGILTYRLRSRNLLTKRRY
jgi:hypothetical protein